MDESKSVLYVVPVASTSFLDEAYFDGRGREPAIRFEYENDGEEFRGAIAFKKVLAIRSRAESCCLPWHIEGAYDTLVEIEQSSWAEELKRDMHDVWRAQVEVHHYMIYLDSVGCSEVLAESWSYRSTRAGSER